ncbi:MAG: hypothetical protein H6Q19_865 [Bacteroidetes bacterium]|nr:hypothetical protein [Bacteroidota bacterium]
MKKENKIGCCGIDCGLCPRFYTIGSSACPGCCGLNFREKHPTCGFVTCCVNKKGLETCADCDEFPCSRFDKERHGFDSFVTHQKVFSNLNDIKTGGLKFFIDRQRIRMELLKDFLARFDDGRSKSFYCLACALLPIDRLQDCQQFIHTITGSADVKQKSKMLKDRLQQTANDLNIELSLNNRNK